ncbi:MAG: hypothetical protein MJZ07_08240 [Bacteroidales bacterium]|nr:hypothetical protein [Bacteroidales bacterium]
MTREQIDNNRALIIEELRNTKREGVEELIARLDKTEFFTAVCKGHDEAPGGAANQALWRLWFARKSAAAEAIEDEDLVLACLGGVFSPSEAIRSIVAEADKDSIGYCDCLPFGTEPEPEFEYVVKDEYIDVVFDQDDYRMWIGTEGHNVFDGSENLSTFQVHHVISLPARNHGRDEILVLGDDAGLFSLMFLSEDGSPALYYSDRRVFAYTDFVFYISRFPQYRSSYIAARNTKGRWGVFRVTENRKNPNDHKILCSKLIEFTYRDPDKAVDSMRGHSGSEIKVRDSYFYTRI